MTRANVLQMDLNASGPQHVWNVIISQKLEKSIRKEKKKLLCSNWNHSFLSSNLDRAHLESTYDQNMIMP